MRLDVDEVHFLLNHGALPNKKDHNGNTALHLLVFNYEGYERSDELEDIFDELLLILMLKKANFNIKNKDHKTMLGVAEESCTRNKILTLVRNEMDDQYKQFVG